MGDIGLSLGLLGEFTLTSATIKVQESSSGDYSLVSMEASTLGMPNGFGLDDMVPEAAFGFAEVGELPSDLADVLESGQKYLYFDISAGDLLGEFAGVDASVTVAVNPFGDAPALYVSLSGVFPDIGPFSLDEVAIGFAPHNSLLLVPAVSGGIIPPVANGDVYLMAAGSITVGDKVSLTITGQI